MYSNIVLGTCWLKVGKDLSEDDENTFYFICTIIDIMNVWKIYWFIFSESEKFVFGTLPQMPNFNSHCSSWICIRIGKLMQLAFR